MDYQVLYSLVKKLPEKSLRAMKIVEGLKKFTYMADFELPEAGECDIFVLPVDGPGLPAVDPDQHLLPGPQGEDGPLPLQRRRNDGPGVEPPVLPFLSPPGPRLNGNKPAFDGFVKGQLFHRGKKGQGQGGPRYKIVLFKLLRPDPEPVFPLPANIHRIPLLRLNLQTLALPT